MVSMEETLGAMQLIASNLNDALFHSIGIIN